MVDGADDRCPTVAIVGGGCSGVLTAAQLLRSGTPCRIVLIDRAPIGGGIAYSHPSPSLLLNVPASRMSAFPDEPDHFVRWAADRLGAVDPMAFLPRRIYGSYLTDVLREAETTASSMTSLARMCADATAVIPAGSGDAVTVGLRDGRHVRAGRVVLALGNFPPATPKALDHRVVSSGRYIADPWAPGALASIRPTDDVVLIGTGLTAVDVALLLSQRGHTGSIHAISRHGLLPHAHLDAASPPRTVTLPAAATARSARGLLAAIRAACRDAVRRGDDWRPVIDGLRPVTQQLWRSLPDDERRVFVRYLARYWDVHRHRMPPSVATTVQSLLDAGRFTVSRAAIEHVRTAGPRCEVRFEGMRRRPLTVDRIVNCTGPRCDVAGIDHPVVRTLLAAGVARPGSLGMGFDVDDHGAVVDRQGRASSTVFTIGALRKGALWETTAVPEIAAQAAALAGVLVRSRRGGDLDLVAGPA